MLATAVGLKAVQAGYRVYYTTAADLVARTTRSAIEGRWQTTMRFWAGPAVLIVDLCRYRDYADIPVAAGLNVPGCMGFSLVRRPAYRHSHRLSRNARTVSGGL
jgi:hypothetical protein